jgi:UPF0755 protein
MPRNSALKWHEPLVYVLVTVGFAALAIVVGISLAVAFTVELMTKPKTFMRKILAGIVIIGIVCSCGAWWVYTADRTVTDGAVSVTVDSATTFASLTADLKDAGLLDHPRLFKAAARLRGVDRRLMVGRYDFSGKISTRSILDMLASGDVASVLVTIPEGLSVEKTAGALQSQLGFDSTEVMAVADDADFLKRQFGLSSLEGYLFPETYRFPVGATLTEVITQMISDCKAALVELREDYSSDLTDVEILTLASIIEAEATVGSERETISSVYHNRLRRGMLLQADPTVRFALKLYHRKLYYKDLDVDNPYNTYRFAGLPPGPICSPGRASIEAAFNPAQTEFLYFVADGSGGHAFNTDLAGHNRSKAEIKANGNR